MANVKARHSARPGVGSSHLSSLKSMLILIVVHFSGITFALFHRVSHKTLYMVLVSILATCPGHRSVGDLTTGVLTVLGDITTATATTSTTTTTSSSSSSNSFLKFTRPHRYAEYFVLTFVGFCELKTYRKLSELNKPVVRYYMGS